MAKPKGKKKDRPLTLISRATRKAIPATPATPMPAIPRMSSNTMFRAVAEPPWTTQCGVIPYSGQDYCQIPGREGGNCISDGFLASESGDILFFSPEQLDGSKGIPNQWNLYDYRGGRDQFVAAFTSGSFCPDQAEQGKVAGNFCSNTPIARLQVTPSGAHLAFLTASQITSYDNAGHLEMYTYEPSTERLTCVSCNPSGAPPTTNVQASQDGLFLTNDGRAFFSTEEALVPNDTDNSEDVYEYVEGRPQLITPGTGDSHSQPGGLFFENPPGLDGVSANGTDVYFSTYDTFVPQDLNGNFLKFYDARTDGGFPATVPPPPCEAADECHGAGSAPPSLVQGESSAELKPGNADPSAHHKKKHQKRAKRKRHTHRGVRSEPVPTQPRWHNSS